MAVEIHPWVVNLMGRDGGAVLQLRLAVAVHPQEVLFQPPVEMVMRGMHGVGQVVLLRAAAAGALRRVYRMHGGAFLAQRGLGYAPDVQTVQAGADCPAAEGVDCAGHRRVAELSVKPLITAIVSALSLGECARTTSRRVVVCTSLGEAVSGYAYETVCTSCWTGLSLGRSSSIWVISLGTVVTWSPTIVLGGPLPPPMEPRIVDK